MSEQIKKYLAECLGVQNPEFSLPPKPEMGDIAFGCFALAKEMKKNPAEVAKELVEKIQNMGDHALIQTVQSFGPYVNFFLNAQETARLILKNIQEQGNAYGTHSIGAGKKYLIEFACPNPLKAMHLGHIKNLITGESVVRIFENAGYEVVRVNYQGDVGMHVAKALWGIFDWKDQFEAIKTEPLNERVEFLGKAYAHGATHYEESDAGKEEVVKYNDIVYENSDADVMGVYTQAREWSLEYFDVIYKRMNSHFDHLYFESQMFERGVELVQQGLKKNIFEVGEGGAIIFPGAQHGLHDRVFINSKGFPTYEAKDLALAESHFKGYSPDMVVHVVGKEQTEYFRVLFKALELVFPQTVGKEYHLIGGFLQLKGDEKMSSRKGNIITGEQLIDEVQSRIETVMDETLKEKKVDRNNVVEKVTAAALKYGMLRSNVSQDVAFDMQESLSVSGESGPYLLYIVARIKSILRKVGAFEPGQIPGKISAEEKNLLLKLSNFPEVTQEAVESYDPSKIAKYAFELAQSFNSFYQACPVLQAEEDVKNFRLLLIQSVLMIMEKALHLLGIESVEEM